MMTMVISAAKCDVCGQYKLCWEVAAADVCAACLRVAGDIVTAVDDFGFIGETPKPASGKKK